MKNPHDITFVKVTIGHRMHLFFLMIAKEEILVNDDKHTAGGNQPPLKMAGL